MTGLPAFARMLILAPGPRFLAVAMRVRGAAVWNLPGGKIAPGEAPLDAAIREEIGVAIARDAVEALCVRDLDFSGTRWRGHFFVSRLPVEPRIAAPEEIVALRWVDAAEAAALSAPRGAFDEVFALAVG